VLAKLEVSDWCERVEIAGAGFLNFRLKPSAVPQRSKGLPGGDFSNARQLNSHGRRRLHFAQCG